MFPGYYGGGGGGVTHWTLYGGGGKQTHFISSHRIASHWKGGREVGYSFIVTYFMLVLAYCMIGGSSYTGGCISNTISSTSGVTGTSNTETLPG